MSHAVCIFGMGIFIKLQVTLVAWTYIWALNFTALTYMSSHCDFMTLCGTMQVLLLVFYTIIYNELFCFSSSHSTLFIQDSLSLFGLLFLHNNIRIVVSMLPRKHRFSVVLRYIHSLLSVESHFHNINAPIPWAWDVVYILVLLTFVLQNPKILIVEFFHFLG